MIDRCRHSLTAMTQVELECNSNDITGICENDKNCNWNWRTELKWPPCPGYCTYHQITSESTRQVSNIRRTLRPSHTAQNSRKRMNHAQNLVVRACPSRIWPFLLTYVMKNHRWIAQELRKDHAQITNKPRTSAHRHEKAPNRANAWLCVTNTRRKTTHNQRTVASELRMNRAWFTHELRKECAGGAEVAFIPRI